MALTVKNFTTGPAASLVDTSELSYNSCVFSPLFETQVSGVAIKDNATRTVKLMEYTISVDGYVTLPAGVTDIAATMDTLSKLLTAQAGSLVYKGRGMDLVVNPPGGGLAGVSDVAWGPVPELLEFQPLGGGRSAKVKWQVKTRVTEPRVGAPPRVIVGAGLAIARVLQFNYETVVSYAEDGYSSLSVRGTLEIPLTRTSQATRTLTKTVDDLRDLVETRIMSGIDLSRFIVVKRDFNVSRDKRTLEWDFHINEKPYMDLPPDCPIARGTYSVRPANSGMGLCLWLCTIRGTYIVRKDRPRRLAWFRFLSLLKHRMSQSALGEIPPLDGNQNPGKGNKKKVNEPIKQVSEGRKAFLIDLSIDEGVYIDSKTVSFSATWRLVTVFSHILLASGLWRKLDEEDAQGKNLWATSMKDIQGAQSWLPNRLDPKLDIIVDFGGG